jgi:hypothetical protein
MTPDRDPQEQLEQLITRALRDQPQRRAPATLASRVLAQVESGAASRWRRGFAHWPIAARVAFVAASFGFVKVGLMVAAWLTDPLDASTRVPDLPPQLAWIQALVVVSATVLRSVPSLWLHAGIALLAIMYAALFGIGASAYRTLRAAH